MPPTSVDSRVNVVIVTPEPSPTVIVSPAGAPGPAGTSINVLGRLAAGTLPSAFPTSPAPQRGSAWSVGGTELWVWSGTAWISTFELPTSPTFAQDYTLPIGQSLYTATVVHNLNTLDVAVTTRLMPTGEYIGAAYATPDPNTVTVTLATTAAWPDVKLRVQVRA